jgi:serine/threonine protein kinase
MTQPLSTAPTAEFALLDVPCAQCGDPVACEVAVPAGPLTTYCEGCRSDLLEAPALPPGYDVVQELGRGGMGAVFLARHRALGLERAVKVILPEGALSEGARERFVQEARLHARLTHPRVVQVHDLAEPRPGVFAIVMEYLPGGDTSRLLKKDPRGIEPALAVAIAEQALEAIDYVHGQGVLHCDVKDPNLLLAAPGDPWVKLGDFGLARAWAATGGASRRRSSITSGTLPYMSPEQAGCLEVGPPSDLFSLGATLYHLLTGAYPHDFPEGCDRLQVAREGVAVPVASRRPSVPAALAAVVDRSLARDVSQRYGSAAEMRAAVRAAA